MEELKTIDIKGNPYVEVSERQRVFRENPRYSGYKLITEIFELTDERVVMQAKVLDQFGQVVATGTAYEEKGSNFINKTSFIENCETSAWGRALANLGIGITSFIRSADEHLNAENNQEPMSEEQAAQIKKLLHNAQIKDATRAEIINRMSEFDPESAQKCIWYLEANQGLDNITSGNGGYGQNDIKAKLSKEV